MEKTKNINYENGYYISGAAKIIDEYPILSKKLTVI